MSNLVYPNLDQNYVRGLSVGVVKTMEFKNKNQDSPNGYSLRIANSSNPIWHYHLEYNYIYDQFNSPQNRSFYLPHSDIQYFMGFFAAMRGNFDDFLYFDDTDYSAAGLRGGPWLRNKALPLNYAIIDGAGNAQVVTTAGMTGAFPPTMNPSPTSITTDNTVTYTNFGQFPGGWPNAPVEQQVVTDGIKYYTPLQRSIGGLYLEDVADLAPTGGADYTTLQVYVAGAPTAVLLSGPGLATPTASFSGLYIDWGTSPPGGTVTASFQFMFRLMFEEQTQDFEKWAQQLWTIGGSKSKNGSGYVKLKTSRISLV